MTKLYAEPTTPPACGSKALTEINKQNCTLYVPEEAKESYMSAYQWNEFILMEAYDFTTAISTPFRAEEASDAPAYNIQGLPVGKDYKGIVIRNGKKAYIK